VDRGAVEFHGCLQWLLRAALCLLGTHTLTTLNSYALEISEKLERRSDLIFESKSLVALLVKRHRQEPCFSKVGSN